MCFHRGERKPNGGNNLSCSACTEKLVISLLFIPFCFYSWRDVHVLFVKGLVYTAFECLLLSSLYMFWQCNPRTAVTVFQLQSSHKSVTTFTQFHLLCWVQLGTTSATFCPSKSFRIDSFCYIISSNKKSYTFPATLDIPSTCDLLFYTILYAVVIRCNFNAETVF